MFLKWLPWKYLVRRAARRHGFIDPVQVMGWLRRFAQPADVNEPIELLRAGVVFHARGAVNSRAIQQNLDWVWPFWVERQFDPRDLSFVPRAFSLTHINLTHRNWTAVGLPDCWALPIVDPAGLVTPLYDGWSLDCWMLDDAGVRLAPSELKNPNQRMELDGNVAIVTNNEQNGFALEVRIEMTVEKGTPLCQVTATGSSNRLAWLALVLRPYNPEGVSFIHQIDFDLPGRNWRVNQRDRVTLEQAPDRHAVAAYREGDVLLRLPKPSVKSSVTCDIGLASAAALYAIDPDRPRTVRAWAGLAADLETTPFQAPPGHGAEQLWTAALEQTTQLKIPDARLQFLYDAAVRTLVLHSPALADGKGDVFPGPYTYKRFWFRDAAFLLHGLLCINLPGRARRVIERFAERQHASGYFYSQDGEWDSNGEALWSLQRYCELSGKAPPPAWRAMVEKGARWITHKRNGQGANQRHAGLFPPGFSAEHLGHIDYYYWDDFWGVAGLRAAAWMLRQWGDSQRALECELDADQFMKAIDRTLQVASERLRRLALPAAPDRRLDAGAVGSLAAGYPLQLYPGEDPRLRDTIQFLLDKCCLDHGFFQDMIHSGINPYLTLHMAQVLLRAGDERCWDLIYRVAEIASPTGQWPEAVHPLTLGGCMGDGQHAWAAAEWILMLRNCFVREEGKALVIGAGLPRVWLVPGQHLRCGPAPTSFGTVEIALAIDENGINLEVSGSWRHEPVLEIRIAGYERMSVEKPEPKVTRLLVPEQRLSESAHFRTTKRLSGARVD